jgi:hypothetical protein
MSRKGAALLKAEPVGLNMTEPRTIKSWISFRNAASLIFVAVIGFIVLTACGPDKETEALRQENAALRRDAENRDALYGTNTPLTDSARAAAGLSAGLGSASAPKRTDAPNRAEPQITQKDIDDADRLGLPIYPNAKLSIKPGAPNNSVLTGGGVNIVLMESTDKLEPIVSFYTERMAASNVDPNIPGSKKPPARADRVQDKFRVVTLSDVQPGNGMRSVTVHEDVGRCYIELMNITGKQQIPASVLPPGAVNSSRSSKGAETGTASAGADSSGAPPTSSGQSPDNNPLNPPLLLPRGKQ